MTEKTWTEVDRYISGLLIPHDAAMQAALEASAAAGLPDIQVSACQGKLLRLLIQMHGARRVLELGTLGGYSTLWFAGGLPVGGQLITVESEAKHAAVALENIARAGFADKVEVRVGPALKILPQLAAEEPEPFDLIFIDADKENYPEYFKCALRLSRKGSVIIADNVVRNGSVIDPNHSDPRVRAVRRFFELVAAEPRVTATAIQTVGTKGYDGLAIAVVIAD